MNIAFFEVEDWQVPFIQGALKGNRVGISREPLHSRNLVKVRNTEILITFIYSRLDSSILDKLPNLKLIATMSTGFDHIDVDYCRKRGIDVCNVPTYGENTVAEHTFALILALSRKLFPSIRRTHEQLLFEADRSLRGFDLKGKTLGVVGCGNIGKHVARIGVGFEMEVIANDFHKDKKLEKELGIRYASFDTLLRKSDIITLHVPYLQATHHLVDTAAIKKMKKRVFIINTSRGPIIDTDALIKGLKSGHVAGAGLDVLEGECDIKEEMEVLHDRFKATCDLKTILEGHLLMRMDNVVVTPHNAFNSREAIHRILHATIENIQMFMKGKVRNKVG